MENREYRYADHKAAASFRNKIVVICYAVMCVTLILAYLVEVFKGTRSILSYACVFAGCAGTGIAAIVVYLKAHETKAVRYIIGFGFPVIYGFIMFTSNTELTFCYILLLIVLTTIYSDIRLSYAICSLAIIINIIKVIIVALSSTFTQEQITDYEIIMACVILVSVIAIKTSDTIQKINADRFDSMSDEREKTGKILGTTMDLSKSIVDHVALASEEMKKLDLSISTTRNSMEDVVSGVNETTDSVQTQQLKTQEIGTHIENVEKITTSITEHVNTTEQVVGNGKEMMDELIRQVENSQSASKLVAGEMNTLRDNADNMQNILSLINSVATQTGLLALNASIEAARAGEAGKGFAVVASEISHLANQTKEATGNISTLIAGIDTSLTQVEDSVNKLIKSNEEQDTCVSKTAENFEQIHSNTNSIHEQSESLAQMVEMLGTANDAIVESIQNISAVSEEMSARANETLESSKADAQSVGNVAKIVEELSKSAEEMKNL